MKAALQSEVLMTSVHLDSSSFHVDGQYLVSEDSMAKATVYTQVQKLCTQVLKPLSSSSFKNQFDSQ